jgi:hypothetical protein
MSAGRKTSVTRHIDNPNIHYGDGRALPYGSNRAESEARTNQSRPRHRITSFGHDGTSDFRPLIQKEVENLIVKEIAKRIFESMPKDDSRFYKLENLARQYIGGKKSEELFREFAKFETELVKIFDT